MTDLRKAAEMALKSLEEDPVPLNAINNAQMWLRQELAQPEQEPVECMCGICKLGKREWVELTDDELKPLCDEWQIIYGGYVRPFAETIEAKLKEKNT